MEASAWALRFSPMLPAAVLRVIPRCVRSCISRSAQMGADSLFSVSVCRASSPPPIMRCMGLLNC
eukprot:6014404-Pyramimonas_sp.AAC.1